MKKREYHGMSHAPEYRIWCGIIDRCRRPSRPEYPNYGGRGISVCDRWQNFSSFFADVGPRPTRRHSIDRIDNDGNYEPANVRWVTRKVQNNNSRRNRYITASGKTLTIAQWADETGLRYSLIQQRLYMGWNPDRIFSEAPHR